MVTKSRKIMVVFIISELPSACRPRKLIFRKTKNPRNLTAPRIAPSLLHPLDSAGENVSTRFYTSSLTPSGRSSGSPHLVRNLPILLKQDSGVVSGKARLTKRRRGSQRRDRSRFSRDSLLSLKRHLRRLTEKYFNEIIWAMSR